MLSATPASQQGVRLAVPVMNSNKVIVALVRQTVAFLQVHHGEEEFDAVSGRQRDAPVAVDVVRVDAGEMWAAEVAAYSRQELLAFALERNSRSDKSANSFYFNSLLHGAQFSSLLAKR